MNRACEKDEPMWYEDLAHFMRYEKLDEFFPHAHMCEAARLNALMRLSLYSAVLMCLYNEDPRALLIPVVVGVFTWAARARTQRGDDFADAAAHARRPTAENPFMNPNLVVQREADVPAADPTSPDVRAAMDEYYYRRVASDVAGMYGDNGDGGARTFYTVPATTIPNEQHEFAQWLYGQSAAHRDSTFGPPPFA